MALVIWAVFLVDSIRFLISFKAIYVRPSSGLVSDQRPRTQWLEALAEFSQDAIHELLIR